MSDEKKPAPEIILLHETAWQSWMRDASTLAMIVVLIGIGIALESAAMQWTGAIIFWVSFMSRIAAKKKDCERLTPQQAADHLAERFDVVATASQEK